MPQHTWNDIWEKAAGKPEGIESKARKPLIPNNVRQESGHNQAGLYISSNRWKVEVFLQVGHVRLAPPSGKSGLRGHSGSKGTVRDLGGIALWLNTL